MNTKTKKKTEPKAEVKVETKEEDKKKEEKFYFKAEAKKCWEAIVRFVRPYKNLEKKPLSSKIGPFLKKNINMIYLVGCIVLCFLAAYTLFATPGLAAKFSGLVVLLVIFLLFRLTCEVVAQKD